MTASGGHAVVVLAAGGSRRLGQPKQLLTRNGETLLHRVVRLAADTGADRVLVIVGAQPERMRAAIADLDSEPLFNPDWETGLASSLHLAAASLKGTPAATLILACDQPALRADHLRRLLCTASAASSGCAAAAYEGVVGIPAVAAADLLSRAGDLVGDHGLGRLLRALPTPSLATIDAPELALDLDTAADCARAVALGLLDARARDAD